MPSSMASPRRTTTSFSTDSEMTGTGTQPRPSISKTASTLESRIIGGASRRVTFPATRLGVAGAWKRRRIRSSMQLFTALQHRYKVCDPLAACFGFFGGGDAEEETVALGSVEGFEEGFGIGLLRQSGEKILRHLSSAEAVISGFPAPIGFGGIDGGKSG